MINKAEKGRVEDRRAKATVSSGQGGDDRPQGLVPGVPLTSLCTEFESWYNGWRPQMTLAGLRPDDLYYDRKPEKPN